MESAQRNAWEEKEMLSKALEEERQKNMTSVVRVFAIFVHF
jgi:hypothetical protein